MNLLDNSWRAYRAFARNMNSEYYDMFLNELFFDIMEQVRVNFRDQIVQSVVLPAK